MMIHIICGYAYFIIFIDDHSIYDHVYLIKHKIKSFQRIKEFKNKIKKQIKRVSR